MSAACAPGTTAAAAAAKPADVAIRKPFFPMGHSSCCSECPRTAIAGCTLRTILPLKPFPPYVSKTTQILTTFGPDDALSYPPHPHRPVNTFSDRLSRLILLPKVLMRRDWTA